MTGGDLGAIPVGATIAAPRETATKIAIAIAGRKIPVAGPLHEGPSRAVNLPADRSAHKCSSWISGWTSCRTRRGWSQLPRKYV